MNRLVLLALLLAVPALATTNTMFTDLDGDGDLDLFLESLIRTDAGPTFVYLNATDGIGVIPNITQGYFVDVDGDGDEDLYIVRNGKNFLYNKTGTYTFTNATATALGNNLTGNPLAAPGTFFGDIDGDGDIDAFVEGQLFVSNGSFANVNATNLSNLDELPALNYLTFNDINLDNRTDLLGVSTTGSVVVFLNIGDNNADGAPEFYDATRVTGLVIASNANFIASEDIDIGIVTNRTIQSFPFLDNTAPYILDDFEDIYLARAGINQLLIQNPPQPVEPFYVLNTSSFYLPTFGVATDVNVSDPGNSTSAILRDFDDNGFTDIFIANSGSNSQLYFRNGSSFVPRFVNASINISDSLRVAQAADVDNDGSLDIAALGTYHLYLGSETSASVTNTIDVISSQNDESSAFIVSNDLVAEQLSPTNVFQVQTVQNTVGAQDSSGSLGISFLFVTGSETYVGTLPTGLGETLFGSGADTFAAATFTSDSTGGSGAGAGGGGGSNSGGGSGACNCQYTYMESSFCYTFCSTREPQVQQPTGVEQQIQQELVEIAEAILPFDTTAEDHIYEVFKETTYDVVYIKGGNDAHAEEVKQKIGPVQFKLDKPTSAPESNVENPIGVVQFDFDKANKANTFEGAVVTPTETDDIYTRYTGAATYEDEEGDKQQINVQFTIPTGTKPANVIEWNGVPVPAIRADETEPMQEIIRITNIRAQPVNYLEPKPIFVQFTVPNTQPPGYTMEYGPISNVQIPIYPIKFDTYTNNIINSDGTTQPIRWTIPQNLVVKAIYNVAYEPLAENTYYYALLEQGVQQEPIININYPTESETTKQLREEINKIDYRYTPETTRHPCEDHCDKLYTINFRVNP